MTKTELRRVYYSFLKQNFSSICHCHQLVWIYENERDNDHVTCVDDDIVDH